MKRRRSPCSYGRCVHRARRKLGMYVRKLLKTPLHMIVLMFLACINECGDRALRLWLESPTEVPLPHRPGGWRGHEVLDWVRDGHCVSQR